MINNRALGTNIYNYHLIHKVEIKAIPVHFNISEDRNKTESAIRITHIPTGLVVTCQDETSQHKNKAAALKVLRSRLLAAEQEQLAKERAAARKDMVSTGDRSAKIRTYNFPQGRITDHRINFTAFNLDGVMDGEINELIDNLTLADQQLKLTEVV